MLSVERRYAGSECFNRALRQSCPTHRDRELLQRCIVSLPCRTVRHSCCRASVSGWRCSAHILPSELHAHLYRSRRARRTGCPHCIDERFGHTDAAILPAFAFDENGDGSLSKARSAAHTWLSNIFCVGCVIGHVALVPSPDVLRCVRDRAPARGRFERLQQAVLPVHGEPAEHAPLECTGSVVKSDKLARR